MLLMIGLIVKGCWLKPCWITGLCLLAFFSLVRAQPIRYVSDALEVPLRADPAQSSEVQRMLPSGSPVDVLQTDAEKGYTLVQTQNGERGWIATRYLAETPGVRDLLLKVEEDLEKSRVLNTSLQNQLALLTSGSGDLESRLEQLSEENQRLSYEVAYVRKLAASDIDLDEQNRLLQEQVVTLERELQIAQQENQVVKDSRQQTLFLMGAGILLGGILLGLGFARRTTRRRDAWGSL